MYALCGIAEPYPGIIIKKKSQGPSVKKVQSRLNELGATLTVDGVFGSQTEEAVRAFQVKYGLYVDGKVGEDTWTKLFSDIEAPVMEFPPEPITLTPEEPVTPPVKASVFNWPMFLLGSFLGGGAVTMYRMFVKPAKGKRRRRR